MQRKCVFEFLCGGLVVVGFITIICGVVLDAALSFYVGVGLCAVGVLGFLAIRLHEYYVSEMERRQLRVQQDIHYILNEIVSVQ